MSRKIHPSSRNARSPRSREGTSPPPEPGLPRPADHWKLAIGLIALACLAYSNSFGCGFVLDNRGLILHDPRVRDLSVRNLALILQHTYWWPNGESGLYRPFTTLSYLLNFAVLGNGESPAGYHLINLLLHATNTLLACLLVFRLGGQRWQAFFTAALWSVHPVLAESVTNIVGRADLLAAMAVLGGTLIYVKGTALAGLQRALWFSGLALVTAMGVFSKESAAVMPGVLLLYEFVFHGRKARLKTLALGLGATVVPVAVLLVARSGVLAGLPRMEIPYTDNPIAWSGFVDGRLTALSVLGRYARLLIWPVRLSADYSWSQIPIESGVAAALIICLGVAAFTAFLFFLYRASRVGFFFVSLGLLWLLPAANLLFPIGTIMAERFLYLPALGFSSLCVITIYAAAKRSGNRMAAPAIICTLLAAYSARTWWRNQDWKDDLSIARASVATSPESFKTHDLLANVLYASDPSKKDLDQAIAESEKSLAILRPLPEDRRPADPYRFAAGCYMDRGAFAKAIPVLSRFIEIEAKYGMSGRARQAEAYGLLSTAYAQIGVLEQASGAAEHARALDPANPQVYRQRAELASRAGRLDDAAIALIEGVFITSDKTFRETLVHLYQTAMDPRSCALISGPKGPAINPACPVVHQHVCAASAPVVRTLAAAVDAELAKTRKKMFVEQFGCPSAPLEEAVR